MLDHQLAQVGEEPGSGLGLAPDRLHHETGNGTIVVAPPDENHQRSVRARDEQHRPRETRQGPVRPDRRVHVLRRPKAEMRCRQQVAETGVRETATRACKTMHLDCVARSRKRGIESQLEVRELEARQLFSVHRQFAEVGPEVCLDRHRDRSRLLMGLLEELTDELRELAPQFLALRLVRRHAPTLDARRNTLGLVRRRRW